MEQDAISAARDFIEREGRLIERRLAAALFDGGPAEAVVDVLRGYRNPDGGFGHGLEPDKRCPDSLPIDVEAALDVMLAAGTSDETLVRDACDWLARVATPDGAVPMAFPVIEGHPRAEHWSEWTYSPALNPTAGIAGRLYQLGVSHPWLSRATDWTWTRLESGSSDEDTHAIREVLIFLDHVPDQARAAAARKSVGGWLAKAGWYRSDPNDSSYGVSPLDLAPEPDRPARELFDAGVIEPFLDQLAAGQQPDGGWAITWEPPSAAAALEWRGIVTLSALRVLRANGR